MRGRIFVRHGPARKANHTTRLKMLAPPALPRPINQRSCECAAVHPNRFWLASAGGFGRIISMTGRNSLFARLGGNMLLHPVHRLDPTHGLTALGLIAILLAAAAVQAADPPAKPRSPREEAIQSIPFDRLAPEMRARVTAVVNNPSIYRRLPTQTIDCDPEMFLFLVRNPEVVVDIWQIMGITNMTLSHIGPDRYRAADGQGTTGTIEYAYRSADTHVIYSQGTYDGSLAPTRVRGDCVVVLKAGMVRQPNGKPRIVTRMDCFLRIDNVGIDWIARTIQPLLGKTADHNFAETASFVASLSRTAENNPSGMGRLARRLAHVDPQTRQRLAEISQRVADRAEVAQSQESQGAADRVTGATATPAAARIRRSDAEAP